MRNQPAIPPQLQAEIQRRLAAGLPLPEGVVAVPPGQTPPKGAVKIAHENPPSSMSAMGHPSKEGSNPIAEGSEGLKTLRDFGECDIPAESKNLNQQLQQLLLLNGEHQVAELAMGKGLFAGLKMAKHCEKNLQTRVAVNFNNDERLSELTKTIRAAEERAVEIQNEMRTLAESAQKALSERWSYSVKNYGLSPETKFYRIDEDKNVVEEVELRCDQCTAGKEMIDARLAVEEYISTIKGEGE